MEGGEGGREGGNRNKGDRRKRTWKVTVVGRKMVLFFLLSSVCM